MSLDEEPLRRAADALGACFVGDVSVADALRKICDASLAAVPGAGEAAISMTVDAKVGTYVFTHPEVGAIDEAQYETGEGPCVEAFRTGVPVLIASTAEPGPYQRFRRAAGDHGLLSVVTVPLDTGAQVVGALSLYAPMAHAFDRDTVEHLRGFATRVAFLLLNHQAYWDARDLSENLQQAMASRAEIEQAKGIIMASKGCTADEAFAELRAQSQHENVKLRDIAADIVRRAQRTRHR
jgi:transcriptional regulator with GAF, ATPase, and Fis domain